MTTTASRQISASEVKVGDRLNVATVGRERTDVVVTEVVPVVYCQGCKCPGVLIRYKAMTWGFSGSDATPTHTTTEHKARVFRAAKGAA